MSDLLDVLQLSTQNSKFARKAMPRPFASNDDVVLRLKGVPLLHDMVVILWIRQVQKKFSKVNDLMKKEDLAFQANIMVSPFFTM